MSYRCDGGCGGSWDFFKLKNRVWLSIMPRNGLLCLACVEKKLGRPLTLDDFTNDQINRPLRVGYRMARARGLHRRKARKYEQAKEKESGTT
jgi:hypothetical protein